MILNKLKHIKRIKIFKINYFTVTLFFFIWMLFFDSNDLITQYKTWSKLKALKDKKQYYLNNLKILNEDIKKLSTDNDELEKFARERYFMKKPKEHIFIVE